MALIPTLIDTSFLYAILDAREAKHSDCLRVISQTNRNFLFPDVILPEVANLFRRSVGQEGVLTLFQALERTHPNLIALEQADIRQARQIKAKYLQFDFVDCCIMAIAERLKIAHICTLDERDFTQYRPQFTDHLILLPLMENT